MTARHGVVAAGLALLALLGGCGGSEGADLLERSADRTAAVRSGELALEFVISARGTGRDADVGFAIEGPFALPEREGALPRTDLAVTEIAGERRDPVRLVADGRRAWLRLGEQAYVLPPERTERLRSSGGGEAGAALQGLRIERWIADPERSDGERVDGVATDRLSGRLRPAAALNDLLALARSTGTGGEEGAIRGEAAEALDEAREGSSIAIDVGREDRVVRRIRLRVAFDAERARELPGAAGRLEGADVRFDLDLTGPGRAVRIEAPRDALPLSALPAAAPAPG